MIRLHSRGLGRPKRLQRLMLKLAQATRRGLIVEVHLDDKSYRSVFYCETTFAAIRPMTLWSKEEGTMSWIDADVHAGDVFMDVGANIGVYTIAAAHRVGPAGKVYAFEPHKANAIALMRNVALNNFNDRVQVFTCALSDKPAATCFNYNSLACASSGSQLGHAHIPGHEMDFAPAASETVLATSVDTLLADGTLAPPALVKIDVDGNELRILHGMRTLLSGATRPRAIQVEINVGAKNAITEFFGRFGYEMAAQHMTASGKKAAARGLPAGQIAYNAIFRPRE